MCPTYEREGYENEYVETYPLIGLSVEAWAGSVGPVDGSAVTMYGGRNLDNPTPASEAELKAIMEAGGVEFGSMISPEPREVGYTDPHQHGAFVPK